MTMAKATIPINGKAAEAEGSSGADHHQRVDSSYHADHDHDRRQAEGDGAEGSMPFDAASGHKGDPYDEYQHPKGEDRAMDVKDGAGSGARIMPACK
jgi:hypothetical protein